MSYEDYDMSDAEKTGDRKIMLLVMRRILADSLDNATTREIASIAARLQDVIRELEDMGAGAPRPDSTVKKHVDDW